MQFHIESSLNMPRGMYWNVNVSAASTSAMIPNTMFIPPLALYAAGKGTIH